MLIHDAICIDNYPREYLFPEQRTENASPDGRQKRIFHVFPGYVQLAVAQSLHRSDLRPLFLNHSRHCGQADQSRHEEEYHREYLSQVRHTVGIFAIARIIRECSPVIHVPPGFPEISQLLLSIRNLLLGIQKLFFSIFNLLPGLVYLFLSFLPALLIVFPAIFELLLILGNLFLRVRNLLPCVSQLAACVRELGPGIG